MITPARFPVTSPGSFSPMLARTLVSTRTDADPVGLHSERARRGAASGCCNWGTTFAGGADREPSSVNAGRPVLAHTWAQLYLGELVELTTKVLDCGRRDRS